MARKRGRTGSAGRFGARYGRVARRRVDEIEEVSRDTHVCPDCGAERVERQGTGIWTCSRCGHTFAGGTYRPETPGGRSVRRSIRAALAEGEGEGEGEDGDDEPAPDAADVNVGGD